MSLQKVNSFVSVLVLFSLLFCAVFFTGYIHGVFAQTAEQANASCQPAKEREGAKCNATAQGAIIQGTCQGGVCKATSAENTQGKQEKVNENTTEIQKGAQEKANDVNAEPANPSDKLQDRLGESSSGKLQGRLGDNPTAGMDQATNAYDETTGSKPGSETTPGSVKSTRQDGRGWDNLLNETPAARNEILQARDTYVKQAWYVAPDYSNLLKSSYSVIEKSFGGFGSNGYSVFDNGFGGTSYAPTWGGSAQSAGFGSSPSPYASYGSSVQSTGFGETPSTYYATYGGNDLLTAAPFGGGNTSAVVWGAGATPQSGADAFFMQSKAQLDAKNAGTIANYLGDGTDAVWSEKSFGDMVSEGLGNAQQQFEGAWRGLQDGFSNAVTSVQDVFAPSAFDGAFGTDPATAFDTSSGADARVGESVTIEAEGQAIPTFYNDQFVKSINENPRPLPSFGGERFAEYVSSNGAVTRPTGDALSFADAHIQNPAFDVKQSGISVTAVESPFTFEIDRSDTRSALDMPTRSVSPFLSHPNPIVSEDAWKSAGPFNTAPSLSRSPVLGSSVNTAPAGWTADAGGKTPILTSGVGRESVSTGRTSAGVSTGNGSGAMGGRGTAGGGTPAGGMGDLAGMLKSLTDMIKGGGGKGSGGQPQQPPIIAAPNNILATPVPSTQFAPPAPLTPAPQVSVVANPNPTQRDATSIVSWTAVWADAQPATSTRECAVIDATGKTHVDHASTTDSFETPKLSQGAYFVVGCKQSGGKLGSALILVRVEGDTQAPVAPPQAALASYESTNGQSAAGRELAAALAAPQEPAQQNNVACDPNSSSYFDCLSNKILFVDKLY